MINRTLLPLLVLLGALLWTTGCLPDECREPLTPDKSEERVIEQAEGWLDDVDSTDEQEGAILKRVRAYLPIVYATRKKQEAHFEQLIAELMRSSPRPTRVHGLLDTMASVGKGYSHKLADYAVPSAVVLTLSQRRELVEIWRERQRERSFKESWTVNQALALFLEDIDATDAQKAAFWKAKERLYADGQATSRRDKKHREAIYRQILSKQPDMKVIHASVDAIALSLTNLGHRALDDMIAFTNSLNSSQKSEKNAYLGRLRLCKK